MSEASRSRRVLKFGIFEADLTAGELRKNGVKLRLQDQPFQVLTLLLESPGAVVTRDELRQKLWPADTFVDFDNALNRAINKIREALGDSAEEPQFIETLARRGYRFLQPCDPKRESAIRSLAVLPLENLSRDPEQEYFADGLTEALITQLAKISALRVVSRTTAMHYKGVHKPMPEIARELQVDVVVEGTVQRSGDRVRISAQLIDAPNEAHLWAESYERDIRDVLQLEAEVAGAIAREIQVKLTPQEKLQFTRSRPVNPEAYDAYLKGRYHWNKRGLDGLTRSAAFFQQAIEKDPNYAAAYAGLSDTASRLGFWAYVCPEQGCAKARAAAMKAVELEDTLSEAHTAFAFALLHYDCSFSMAEREWKRALELDPQNTTAMLCRAVHLLTTMHLDQAIDQIYRAVQLEPSSMVLRWTVSIQLHLSRRYEQAIAEARRCLDFFPRLPAARWAIALAMVQKGMPELGAIEMEDALRGNETDQYCIGALGHCYAAAGRRSDAESVLNRLQEMSKQRFISPYWAAAIYTSLGDKDEAFRSLEAAFEEKTPWMCYTKVFPWFDPLRSDPRFDDLLGRLKFPA
jgi:TolB-like protein/Flp pilus assembly protein TadD